MHVDDVADAILLALDASGFRQSAYTITGGDYRTLGVVADVVRKVCLPQVSRWRRAAIRLTTYRRALTSQRPSLTLAIGRGIALEDGIRSYALNGWRRDGRLRDIQPIRSASVSIHRP